MTKKELSKYMAKIGAKGGSKTSTKKELASKSNGARGGRPSVSINLELLADRIKKAAINNSNGCLEFFGFKGQARTAKLFVSFNRRNVLAYRAVGCAVFKHDIFNLEKRVLHRCDNPRCVNVKHLFLGTLKDNTQDMLRKNRHVTHFKKGSAIATLLGAKGGSKTSEKKKLANKKNIEKRWAVKKEKKK